MMVWLALHRQRAAHTKPRAVTHQKWCVAIYRLNITIPLGQNPKSCPTSQLPSLTWLAKAISDCNSRFCYRTPAEILKTAAILPLISLTVCIDSTHKTVSLLPQTLTNCQNSTILANMYKYLELPWRFLTEQLAGWHLVTLRKISSNFVCAALCR